MWAHRKSHDLREHYEKHMIDSENLGESTLRLLVFQALKLYSTEVLITFLEDKDSIVRTAAARELHTRGGSAVFDAAETLSKAKRFEVREIAAFLHGQIGTPHLPFREQSIATLLDMLNDDYFEVRAAALFSLGHLRATDALSHALKLVEDAAPEVRTGVAFFLGAVPTSNEVLTALDNLSKDKNAEVRDWAFFALEEK